MAEYRGGICSISAGKLRQQRRDRRRGRGGCRWSARAALGIVGVALLAPAHGEAIALAAVHHEGDGLGGLAERDRQAAGGQRIERAGVAGALGREQPLDRPRPRASTSCRSACRARPSRGRRALAASCWLSCPRPRIVSAARDRETSAVPTSGATCRPVPASFVHLTGFWSHIHLSSILSPRSRCTSGVRNSFSIRSASSNRSSMRKRISGANFKLTRRAISPRM